MARQKGLVSLRFASVKPSAAFESGYIDKVTKETYESMKNALGRINARVKGES